MLVLETIHHSVEVFQGVRGVNGITDLKLAVGTVDHWHVVVKRIKNTFHRFKSHFGVRLEIAPHRTFTREIGTRNPAALLPDRLAS